MLRNYLKMAQRTLQKHPVYTLINAAGLAVGIACCTLILLFVRDELSYDRFHEKAERVYQLAYEAERFGKTSRSTFSSPAVTEIRITTPMSEPLQLSVQSTSAVLKDSRTRTPRHRTRGATRARVC